MLVDSILGTVQINNSTEPIVAVCNTSLTIRQGWGNAEIIGGIAFGDTDDITRAVITAPSWSDANGVSVMVKSDVAAELGPLQLPNAMFDVPIPVAPGDTIVMNVTSETAANTQAYGLIWVRYSGAGAWVPPGSGMKAMVTRQWTADAQLVSNTDTAQTALNTLAASKNYQLAGVRSGGIAAATAGLVGPAFMIFANGPGEFNGAQLIVPLGKGIDVAGQDCCELAKCRFMLTPQFRGGQAFNYRLYGFTAEQPQGEILFFASAP